MDCEQISRPQPVGILAPPEGLLLWPQEQAKAIGESGERAGRPILDDTPLGRYNRFVLEPDLEVYRALQEELSQEFAGLLHLAAFTGGVASQPPEPFGEGEFLGLCRLIRASWFFEQDEPEKAIVELKAGVEASREASPLYFEEAIKRDPNDYASLFRAAFMKATLGDMPGAAEYSRKSYKLFREDRRNVEFLSAVLAKLGQTEEALRLEREAIYLQQLEIEQANK